MQEWIRQVFESPEFGVALLPAALLLGLLTAVGSGCNLAMITAVAGYAGSRGSTSRRDILLGCACFTIGTVLSLAVLGALVGYFGKVAGSTLGAYGTFLAGLVTVFFGLLTLGLVPVRIPSIDLARAGRRHGLLGAATFGLVVGGASTTCTMVCCGPLLPAVLGLAALRGQSGWGALILTMFAVGYSAPLAAIMLGVGLGRLSLLAGVLARTIRKAAGAVLVGVGFWLLATI
ncbi:MAG: cytochrome c biogenesis CcdA family protein [Planctomycetota bacterium]